MTAVLHFPWPLTVGKRKKISYQMDAKKSPAFIVVRLCVSYDDSMCTFRLCVNHKQKQLIELGAVR